MKIPRLDDLSFGKSRSNFGSRSPFLATCSNRSRGVYVVDYDTPHQQYLEVLFKCGAVGLSLYTILLLTCLLLTRRLLRMTARGSPARFPLHAVTSMLVGVMVGNLTQPNLTYSLTGNMIFLLFGSLCSSRAVVVASSAIVFAACQVYFVETDSGGSGRRLKSWKGSIVEYCV